MIFQTGNGHSRRTGSAFELLSITICIVIVIVDSRIVQHFIYSCVFLSTAWLSDWELALDAKCFCFPRQSMSDEFLFRSTCRIHTNIVNRQLRWHSRVKPFFLRGCDDFESKRPRGRPPFSLLAEDDFCLSVREMSRMRAGNNYRPSGATASNLWPRLRPPREGFGRLSWRKVVSKKIKARRRWCLWLFLLMIRIHAKVTLV